MKIIKKEIMEEIYVLDKKSQDRRYSKEHRNRLFDRANLLRKKHNLTWGGDIKMYFTVHTLSETAWKKYKK